MIDLYNKEQKNKQYKIFGKTNKFTKSKAELRKERFENYI